MLESAECNAEIKQEKGLAGGRDYSSGRQKDPDRPHTHSFMEEECPGQWQQQRQEPSAGSFAAVSRSSPAGGCEREAGDEVREAATVNGDRVGLGGLLRAPPFTPKPPDGSQQTTDRL